MNTKTKNRFDGMTRAEATAVCVQRIDEKAALVKALEEQGLQPLWSFTVEQLASYTQLVRLVHPAAKRVRADGLGRYEGDFARVRRCED